MYEGSVDGQKETVCVIRDAVIGGGVRCADRQMGFSRVQTDVWGLIIPVVSPEMPYFCRVRD